MKYITMPDPVSIRHFNGNAINDATGQPATVSFETFVIDRLIDPKFAIDMKAVLVAVEIKCRIQEANGVLALENAHWELLRDVTKEPTGGYNGAVAHNIVPFMSAIVDADDKRPESGEPNG